MYAGLVSHMFYSYKYPSWSCFCLVAGNWIFVYQLYQAATFTALLGLNLTWMMIILDVGGFFWIKAFSKCKCEFENVRVWGCSCGIEVTKGRSRHAFTREKLRMMRFLINIHSRG